LRSCGVRPTDKGLCSSQQASGRRILRERARHELSRGRSQIAPPGSMELPLPASHHLTDLQQIAKIQTVSIQALLHSALRSGSLKTHCRNGKPRQPSSSFGLQEIPMRGSPTGLITARAGSGNSNIPHELRPNGASEKPRCGALGRMILHHLKPSAADPSLPPHSIKSSTGTSWMETFLGANTPSIQSLPMG